MVPSKRMHNPDDLALYYYDGCFYCSRVRQALDDLDVRVEMRNIVESPQHLQDLVAARGRRTVPVLRIRREGGDEWMPESADIVDYLRRRFG
ncbi:Glutaredoxin [Sandaracinus amylolyticus]|nr:Glutaredoxin [Sandaracinus amylolyticus]